MAAPAARADLHAGHQGRDRPARREHQLRRHGDDWSAPSSRGRCGPSRIEIYTRGAEYARSRGIIIADTKFEFGLDAAGKLYLIDEVLTPDSSRFWPAAEYRTGISPPSFDKQYVRDYLETLDWNKKAPGPSLPPDVIRRTTDKYRQALELLTRPD